MIADDMKRNHGLITMADMHAYVAKERAPLRGNYRGYDIISMPPPSSGGAVLIEMLNILEGYDFKKMDAASSDRYHLMTEAMRRAFADRAEYMGDTDFVKVPIETLPGVYLGGNLYRPLKAAPAGGFPAVLSPHGHWNYGRLEHTNIASVPARCINLARQGYVVLAYDMVGYTDTVQTPHAFGDEPRDQLWSFGPLQLQLWNSIRVLDFLQTLPDVRVSVVLAEVPAGIKRPLAQPLPNLVVDFVDLVGAGHCFPHHRPIAIVGILIARNAEQRKVFRQQLLLREVIDRRNELSLGEIAGAAKNYQHD